MRKGQHFWRVLCQQRREQNQVEGWAREDEDFTWLETAFCEKFLRNLTWFGGMDHEWRSGARPEQGGFWVLLWSKDPRRLWWELREELERECAAPQSALRDTPVADLAQPAVRRRERASVEGARPLSLVDLPPAKSQILIAQPELKSEVNRG